MSDPPAAPRRFFERPERVILLLLGATAAYLFLTMPGRGVYWDEYVQSVYGRNVVSWYTSGFSDRSALEQGNLILYGGIVEAGLELIAGALPVDRYPVRHVCVALLTLLGLLGVQRLAAALGRPWLGVIAVALLVVSPRFLGHAFFNSKDIPFTTLYVWTLTLFVHDVRRPLDGRSRTALPLAIVLGLMLGTRIGGTIVLAPLLVGYAARWWGEGRSWSPFVHLAARFAMVFMVAWAIMLAGWPWAQQRPLAHPMTALLASGRFPWTYPQLFGGRFVSSEDLPLGYVPMWFGIATPEVVLLGLVALAVALVVRPRGLRALRDPAVLAVVVAGVLPLAYVIVRRVAIYDALRHLLFVQPLIALAASAGLLAVWTGLGSLRRSREARIGAVALAMLGAALPLSTGLRMRPYEYVYFNHLSGGLPAAEGRFELEYWGLSYREGVEWLADAGRSDDPIRVASCSHPGSVEPFAQPPVRYVGSPIFHMSGSADHLLFTAPHDCVTVPPWTPPPGRVIHTIERYGVPLLTILELDEPFEGLGEEPRDAGASPDER